MLIHIGNNDFVSLDLCEFIVNLRSLNDDCRKRILDALPPLKGRSYKSAIKTVDGKWIGSVLSSEALLQRGNGYSFPDSFYRREDE